ncbi:hypothetical protein [Streptomyces salinarius]|uniref:hypothetical protein n=1 Tax=Streptomyces salinarius TaxID=2762598 RepID=UPI001644F5A2|nr:hypothetical protein [Streptomyces salinarius]
MSQSPKTAVLGRARNPKRAVDAVLDEAARLQPAPGYMNGTDYADWFVEATPDLLRALADLAYCHQEPELADTLHRFSGPMCLEPLYDDLPESRAPHGFCVETVGREGNPGQVVPGAPHARQGSLC